MGDCYDLDHYVCSSPGKILEACGRTATPAGSARSTIAIELAFLGHAFERLARALYAVLVVVAVGWKQLYDTIAAVGGHVAD